MRDFHERETMITVLFTACILLSITCVWLWHRVKVLTEENERVRVVSGCMSRTVSQLSETQPYA
jgi:cell division protein FtsL